MSMTAVVLVVAVAAGVRGVWSPCGLSMLSTITPIGERGRGNRYGSTAAWYIIGATVGGLCLGAAMGGSALLVGDGDGVVRATVVLVAAVVAMASDMPVLAFEMPIHRRQVNERWLDRYRPWVYGLGFGWQVGTGVATYITTAATYLLVVLAVMAASPRMAIIAGTTFGLTRGITVLLTRTARTPTSLHALHQRVQQLEASSRNAVIIVEGAVALVAAASIAPGVVAATLLAAIAAWCASSEVGTGRSRPSTALRERRSTAE